MSLAHHLVLLTAAVLAASAPHRDEAAPGYRAAAHRVTDDTLRPRTLALTSADRPSTPFALGDPVAGFLSARGLPPLAGVLTATASELVFRSADGRLEAMYPLVGPLKTTAGRRWRPGNIALVTVEQRGGQPTYLFRVDAGVFETSAPGPLLELSGHPEWLDSISTVEWRPERTLADPADPAASLAVADSVAASPYADTLYALFGRPSSGIGIVGAAGRAAGRLGEYIRGRDSLALDPARMSTDQQLRHALAHELGHRWQARAAAQLAVLWQSVAPIRDPKRYGYANRSEHQAEAVAFAIHFLQATASSAPGAEQLDLLDHYELLVPGTGVMARYLALQPIYTEHPLRRLLTGRGQ